MNLLQTSISSLLHTLPTFHTRSFHHGEPLEIWMSEVEVAPVTCSFMGFAEGFRFSPCTKASSDAQRVWEA